LKPREADDRNVRFLAGFRQNTGGNPRQIESGCRRAYFGLQPIFGSTAAFRRAKGQL